MKKGILISLIALLCFSFTSDLQKRIVRQDGFDIECYIAIKELNSFNANKVYYWYKSGEIHNSQSNIGGNVLHNTFIKYYRSNQLAEKGDFDFGLKTGIWQSWHENGQLKIKEYWNNGYREGNYYGYDQDGQLTLKGKYRKNIKVGQWINYANKDTLYYKKGIGFDERPKGLIERLLRKKDSVEKATIKFEKIHKRRTDSIKKEKLKRSRLIKKQKDSIAKSQEKLRKLNQKKLDSIDKANNPKQSFLERWFKKNDQPKKATNKKSKFAR